MKKNISVIVAVAALVGTSLLFAQQTAPAASSGRWQVVAGSNETILIDTLSGETWSLAHVVDTVSHNNYSEWVSIERCVPATQPSNGR